MRAASHQLDLPLELEIVDLTKRAQREPKKATTTKIMITSHQKCVTK